MIEDIEHSIKSAFSYRSQIYLGKIFNRGYEFYIETIINTHRFMFVDNFFKDIKNAGVVDKNQKQEESIYIIGRIQDENAQLLRNYNEYSTIYRLYFIDRMSHAHQVLLRENNMAKYYDFLNGKVILLRKILDTYFPVDRELLHVEYKLRRRYNVKV